MKHKKQRKQQISKSIRECNQTTCNELDLIYVYNQLMRRTSKITLNSSQVHTISFPVKIAWSCTVSVTLSQYTRVTDDERCSQHIMTMQLHRSATVPHTYLWVHLSPKCTHSLRSRKRNCKWCNGKNVHMQWFLISKNCLLFMWSFVSSY